MSLLRHYKMVAKDGQGDALRAALVDLAARVRPLEGCDDVQVLADPRDPATYVFIEHWRSIDDHKAAGAILGKAAFEPVSAVLLHSPEGRYLERVC